jgi:two-component system response regulator GlrR
MSQLNVSEPNVLLVDDDESLLCLMAIRLKGEGYNVQCSMFNVQCSMCWW